MKPSVSRRLPLAIMLSLLVPSSAFAVADPALDAHELEFLKLINEYRAQNGLGCLAPSPTLNAAAAFMSQAMGEQDFTSHNEPPCDMSGTICTGRDPGKRIRDFGHAANGWGENLAMGAMSAKQAFEGWRNSPGHNANMLHPMFTAIGIAREIVPGSRWDVYWTTPFSNSVDGPWDCEGKVVDGSGDTNDDELTSDPFGCSKAGGGVGLAGLLAAAAWFRGRRRIEA